MSTPILPFAVWAPGTNQNSIPANDNSLRNQILNGLVISDSTDAQPGSPTDGDIYIITGAATGTQWATFDEFDLAIFMSGTWYAFAPVEGITVNIAETLSIWDGAAYVAAGGGGSGTVTSVSGSGGTSGLTLTGGPITTSGTLTIGGTLALANGGIGTALTDPNADRILFWDDSAGVFTFLTVSTGLNLTGTTLTATGTGTGDVVGPASAVNNNIAVFDTTTGKLIKDGGATIASLAPVASPTFTGTPAAPTASAGTSTTQLATTAFVNTLNVQSIASSSTPTPTSVNDQLEITALAANMTLTNPTGTMQNGWGLSVRIKDNSTPRTIAYGTQYRAVGVTLPTTTVASKTLYLGMVWNGADTIFDIVSVAQQA